MSTPFQQHPHHFCNGKFKVTHPNWGGTFVFGLKSEFVNECISSLDADISDCTLIARPISGMTDDECREFVFPALKESCNPKKVREDLTRSAWEGFLPFKTALDLIEIGVYRSINPILKTAL